MTASGYDRSVDDLGVFLCGVSAYVGMNAVARAEG
jgi:hypothetical protein